MARILVIQNMYPPHHYGGYELSCRDVVERWRERGHHVDVLCSSLRLPDVDDPAGETDVWRRLPISFADGDLVSPPLWRRPGRERHSLAELHRALSTTRPDVVSVWHLAALSFGMLTPLLESGVPLVYVVCDDWLSYGPRIDPWMRMFDRRPRLAGLVKRLSGLPTAVPDLGRSGTFCFVSDLTRRRSLEYTDWKFEDSTVTYSGIDAGDFPTSAAPTPRPWTWNLLHVGRLDERKGIDTAIRALPLLPEAARLLLLGRGDPEYRARLDRLVDDLALGSRVRFDVVDRAVLRDHYRSADVLLFPTAWDEPFGLVPIEAMASGTPVVATAAGGSAEFLVDGANCVAFPQGDHHALAAAVQRLADDPALRSRLVAGGRATAAEFTVDRLAAVLEAWHLAAANRFRDGRPPHRPVFRLQPE